MLDIIIHFSTYTGVHSKTIYQFIYDSKAPLTKEEKQLRNRRISTLESTITHSKTRRKKNSTRMISNPLSLRNQGQISFKRSESHSNGIFFFFFSLSLENFVQERKSTKTR